MKTHLYLTLTSLAILAAMAFVKGIDVQWAIVAVATGSAGVHGVLGVTNGGKS